MATASDLRSCLAAAILAAAATVAGTATAGPIFEPGTRVIVNANLRANPACCGATVSDPTLAEAAVSPPPDPSALWYPPNNAVSRGRASLAEGSLKAEVLVPKHPTRNISGRAEAALNEVVTLALPSAGVAAGDMLTLRFLIDGTIVSPGSPNNIADFAIAAGFRLRDPTLFDPGNPDAPIPDVISYQKSIVQPFRFGRSEFTSFLQTVGSGEPVDDTTVEGLAEGRLFGFEATLPIDALLEAIGESRTLEFSAWLYLSADVNSEAADGAATTHLNFLDTAVIRATLPPGYAFLSESGFLSGSAATPEPTPDPVPMPTPVPEPASALLLLGGLAGLAAARRRR